MCGHLGCYRPKVIATPDGALSRGSPLGCGCFALGPTVRYLRATLLLLPRHRCSSWVYVGAVLGIDPSPVQSLMGVSIRQHMDYRPNCRPPWVTHRVSMTLLTARVSALVTLHFGSKKSHQHLRIAQGYPPPGAYKSMLVAGGHQKIRFFLSAI